MSFPFRTVLGLALLLPVLAQGQARPPRRWTATLSVGSGWGGPSASMANELRDAGFTDALGCFFICGEEASKPGPFRDGIGSLGRIEITRAVATRWEAGLAAAHGDMGSAFGIRDWQMIGRYWSITTVDALILYAPSRTFRIGAGPTLASLRSSRTPTQGPFTAHARVGLALEAGARTSATKRLFADFAAQYRLLGSESEGPFLSSDAGMGGRILRQFDAPSRHLAVSVGIGVRW